MKYFYKVLGKANNKYYILGYTSNKWAWIKNSNGWKKEALIFEKIYK